MTTRFNPFRRAETAPDPIPETNGATTTALVSRPSSLDRFIAAYGQPPSTLNSQPSIISLPYGQMAVTLCAKFNDSAPQVDHFNYHAHLGCPEFALLIVPKQAKTEKLARRALSLIPDLAIGGNVDWTWKSEHWSGGNGNYLQSSSFELPPELRSAAIHTFGGEPVSHAFWEIEFTTNLREGQTVELYPHKNFRAASLRPSFSLRASKISARIELNLNMNGVEIHFSRRPDDAALQPLRADRRWRYTGYSRCWYCRQTPETIVWANDFVTRFNGDNLSPAVTADERTACLPPVSPALNPVTRHPSPCDHVPNPILSP